MPEFLRRTSIGICGFLLLTEFSARPGNDEERGAVKEQGLVGILGSEWQPLKRTGFCSWFGSWERLSRAIGSKCPSANLEVGECMK